MNYSPGRSRDTIERRRATPPGPAAPSGRSRRANGRPCEIPGSGKGLKLVHVRTAARSRLPLGTEFIALSSCFGTGASILHQLGPSRLYCTATAVPYSCTKVVQLYSPWLDLDVSQKVHFIIRIHDTAVNYTAHCTRAVWFLKRYCTEQTTTEQYTIYTTARKHGIHIRSDWANRIAYTLYSCTTFSTVTKSNSQSTIVCFCVSAVRLHADVGFL